MSNTAYTTYIERVLTIPPVILGYQLKPFNLGHSMILRAANSKFINGAYNSFLDLNSIIQTTVSDTTLIPEFVFCVLVCSTTYDEFKTEASSGEFEAVLNDLKDRVAKTPQSLLFEIHNLAHYLNKGTRAPIAQPKSKSGGDNLSDSIISPEEAMMSVLMGELGYTRDECLNLPLTETLSAYLLYCHKMDSVELISKDVYEMMENLKKGIGK